MSKNLKGRSNFMAVITPQKLSSLRKKYIDKKIVFCSGVFDLTHAGHCLFFEDCRKQGDILVVDVGPDRDITLLKGPDRPVMNEHVRLKMVDSLKPVDYCFVGDSASGHPLSRLESIFMALKPDIYAVNNDAFDMGVRKQMIKKYGIKLVVLQRSCPTEFDDISTTRIIEKIRKMSSGKNDSHG